MRRYIIVSPDRVKLVHLDGEFRLVKDVAKSLGAKAAINFGFFAMSRSHPVGSYPVGQVQMDGSNKVLSPSGAEHFHGVYKKDGEIKFWDWLPSGCEWGIRAGPRLVENGEICERSILDNRWSSGAVWNTVEKPRVAIGLRFDGKIVLAYWSSTVLRRAALDMLSFGCIEALAGDGGGSASWYDKDNETHVVSQRVVPNLFVVEGDEPYEGGYEEDMSRPKVYLSPSNQGDNVGEGNYGTEQERMEALAFAVGAYLSRAGVAVAISRPDQTKSDAIAESNAFKPAYHICIHSNASAANLKGCGKGTEGFYWPGSKGEALTKAIVSEVSALNPNGFRRTDKHTTMMEIKNTNAPCAYIEVGFHDREDEANWIIENTEKIAYAIAKVIGEHLGVPVPEVAADDSEIISLIKRISELTK